jgi:hypothetical protein
MSEQNGSSHIQNGTAEGLLEFLEYVVKKGYGSAAAVNPWKSAARQVLQTVEKSDDYGGVDVRGLDLADYLDRFETLARGDLKVESIDAYRRRFTKAVQTYLAFIQDGKPPTFRQGGGARRPKAETTTLPKAKSAGAGGATAAPIAAQPPGERMIDYPFPLGSGAIAMLRLPARLEKLDAERLAAYLRTLVLEPQKELTQGDGER